MAGNIGQNPNRQIDKTFLSLDLAESRGLIHRDYISHCMRWSHVAKFLQKSGAYATARILDVGCGKELPLPKTLYVNKMSTQSYIGVDANDLNIPPMLAKISMPIKIWAETDVCALDPEDVLTAPSTELPNVLVCYEVLEHVQPEHARRMLQHFQTLTSPDAHFFISTPCYNGSAAGNHINEMTFSALGSLICDLGYKIEGVFGTFASIADYKHELNAVTIYDKNTNEVLAVTDLVPVFNALRNYYDTNVLSVIFAPLFPAKSRNCLWHLTKQTPEQARQERMFNALETIPGPWSQHPQWRELNGPDTAK